MKSLLEIKSFGGTAAENDEIDKYFLETPVFDRLWEGERCIVAGRKGTGKTALFIALQNRAKATKRPYRSASFRQYPWSAHEQYTSNESAPIERYVESWHFFLLIQTFIALNDAKEHFFSPATKPLSEVRKFIKDNYGNTDQGFNMVFPQGGFSLKSITPKLIPLSSATVDVSLPRESANLGRALPRLNEWLEGKLRAIAEYMPPTYVLFDELDLGFNPKDESYTSRLAGLLIATQRYAKWCAEHDAPVRPIVFLRSDILNSLHFGDLNKIREANLLELKGHDNVRSTHGESLKALIDFRISKAMNLPEDIENPWEAAFENRRMRGNQNKFQHITFRTFLRPRDVIKFCNLALEEAQRDGASIITNEHINRAQERYSEFFYYELDDEIGQTWPNWKEGLDVLRKIETTHFTRKDFEEEYAKMSKSRNLSLDPTEMLNMLYQFSIIGYTTGKETDVFRYKNESFSFDIQAKSFRVHRGLKKVLGLTEGLSERH